MSRYFCILWQEYGPETYISCMLVDISDQNMVCWIQLHFKLYHFYTLEADGLMTHRGFIDGFTLKVLMVILMVLDHLYYKLFPDYLEWGHYAARVVAPVFVYLVTEGMVYTHNRRRYIQRMLLAGVVMMAGNMLLFAFYRDMPDNSILMTLGLSAAIIATIDKSQETDANKALWILATIGLFALSMFFEGSFMIPGIAVIFYYLRDRPLAMWAVYIGCFGGMYLLLWVLTGKLQSQFFMVFAFIPILCYNGKRGMNNAFSKYFFYVFYPLHIWVIFIAEQVLL